MFPPGAVGASAPPPPPGPGAQPGAPPGAMPPPPQGGGMPPAGGNGLKLRALDAVNQALATLQPLLGPESAQVIAECKAKLETLVMGGEGDQAGTPY